MALMIHLYFKPHELTPRNPTKDFSWPRLAIQLSKEQCLLIICKKQQTKKRPDKNCRDANSICCARSLIVDAD
jgi:hypothetical protein